MPGTTVREVAESHCAEAVDGPAATDMSAVRIAAKKLLSVTFRMETLEHLPG